jgi:hypothetical protein
MASGPGGLSVFGGTDTRRARPSEISQWYRNSDYLRFLCCCVFRKRTPGPPPFSDMN